MHVLVHMIPCHSFVPLNWCAAVSLAMCLERFSCIFFYRCVMREQVKSCNFCAVVVLQLNMRNFGYAIVTIRATTITRTTIMNAINKWQSNWAGVVFVSWGTFATFASESASQRSFDSHVFSAASESLASLQSYLLAESAVSQICSCSDDAACAVDIIESRAGDSVHQFTACVICCLLGVIESSCILR